MIELLERTNCSKIDDSNPLMKCLHELAIDPFHKESVEQYKKKKLDEYWLRLKIFNFIRDNDDYARVFTLISIVVFSITSLVMSAALIALYNKAISLDLFFPYFAFPFLGTVFCSLFFVSLVFALDNFHMSIPIWNWNRIDNIDSEGNIRGEIADSIPDFVKQTIKDINENVYGCQFHVLNLEFNKIIVDPFLVVAYRSNDYYVEVWNESYQKQRMV